MVYTYLGPRHWQYDQVFSSWDWHRLPGITAAVQSPMLPCAYAAQLLNDSRYMNATGSVSDNVSGMHLSSLL
jgi:hypothetical protein